MIDLMLLTFRSGIHCCVLLSCSFVRLVFIGSNDPNVKERKKERKKDLKLYQGGKLFLLQNISKAMRENVLKISPFLQRAPPCLKHQVLQVNILYGAVCVCVCVCGGWGCRLCFVPVRFEVFTAVLQKCKVFCDL